MPSKLSQWCNAFIEAGWLIAVVAIPLFFNIHSDRVFEPDKLTLLRSIALLMAGAWLVGFIDRQGWENVDWLKWDHPRSIWRMPFVLPVFLLVVVYIISSLFSVTPVVSWTGSYQRLQGTYTTLAYIVVFVMVATHMRTQAQVRRVVTAVIITSIPISFYAVLQHYGLDPLPWGGDTQRRVAGHMGNAIFIAAYLIMALPLTVGRIIEAFTNILSDEELSYADVIRASIYIFAVALQILAMVWTRSRGPFVGIGVGMFAFGLIVLVSLRNAVGDKQRIKGKDIGWATLVGSVVLLGLLVAAFVPTGASTSFLIFVAGVGLSIVAILGLVAAGRGWRWLWLSWLLVAGFVGLWVVLFNLPQEVREPLRPVPVAGQVIETLDEWRRLPEVGRLGRVLEADERTSRVRVLIWEGALDLILPHEPLRFPDGSQDRWNVIRPLIGYGPESMYVAYNRFYPPELGTIEARNASPDRSHNETFDALVITGLLGFLVWQILYLSVFYYGFKWLGVVRNKRERNLLIGLWIGMGLLTALGFSLWRGPEYLGVALPFGSIGGLALYLIYHALFAEPDEGSDPFAPERLLMVALIAAIIAHYIEIHFGIAIAATRLHFFTYVGLMFVLGYLLPQQAEAPVPMPVKVKGRRRVKTAVSTPTGGAWSPLLMAGLVIAVALGIMGYQFITYSLPPDKTIQTAADLLAGEIFHQSLFVNASSNFADSPFIFLMMMLTWGLGTLVFLSEMIKSGEWSLPLESLPLSPQPRQITMGLLGSMVVAGLLLRFVFTPDPGETTAALGRGLALFWSGVNAVGLLFFLTGNPLARTFAGLVAVAGLVLALPIAVAGGVWYALLTALLYGGMLYIIWDKSWRATLLPVGVVATAVLAIGLTYTYIQASLLRASILFRPTEAATLQALRIAEASRSTIFLTVFYIFIITLMIILAFVLAQERESRGRVSLGTMPAFVALLVVAILGSYLISRTNMRVIQADIVYKRAKPFDDQAARTRDPQLWDSAIAIYEHAIDLAPEEDFYYLFLGRAYLEKSTVTQDPQEQLSLMQEAEWLLLRAQDLNPLNTDHTANLARLNTRWSQLAADPGMQVERIDQAEHFYQEAVSLSPQNSIIRNEFAGLLLELKQDCDAAIAAYDEAVRADPYYPVSYFARANAHINCAANLPEAERNQGYQLALASIEEGLELDPNNVQGWQQLGQLNQQLGNYEAALAAFDEARVRNVNNRVPAWNIDYLAAFTNYQMGERDEALRLAQQALATAPPEATPQIEQLLTQIDPSAMPAPPPPEPEGEAELPPFDDTALSGDRPLADLPPAMRANFFDSPPPLVIDPNGTYEALLVTERGDIRLRLFASEAPLTVNNFVFLAEQGYYDATTFHRVLEDFMAQAGDPTGTGSGGPGYMFRDETDNGLLFDRPGILAMANAGPNTNGSQFFITFVPTPWLNGNHTIFGEVISGEQVLDQLTRRDPETATAPGDLLLRVEIEQVD
jgi:cyclophilin family peptidyl-prolyl cis-trans isomerase/tetratricopeptide (TPR) repeat protein